MLGKFRYCFPAGTLIATPDGKVAIESLKEGDDVVSWDTSTKRQVIGKVSNTFTRFSQNILAITLDDDTTIETTGAHPFWVANKGWKLAGDLGLEMTLHGLASDAPSIRSIERKHELTTVFNFEVLEFHNYFAGETAVLVHNETLDDIFTNSTKRRKPRSIG